VVKARDVEFMEERFAASDRSATPAKNCGAPIGELLNYGVAEDLDGQVVDDGPETDSEVRSDFDASVRSVTDPDEEDSDEDFQPNQSEPDSGEFQPEPEQPIQPVGERRYPLRNRRRRAYPDHHVYQAVAELPADPVSVEEITSRHDSDTWRAAMGEEMSSFVENDAWVLVDKPADQKVVQCKWVFKLEHGSDGQPSRYKAGLVARGLTQQAGLDYDENFARVVRRETIRLLIALAAELSLQIHHLNVRAAFLNGELDERIFMNQPKGFIYLGEEKKLCLLKKALCGLKQASR
jgi:hypothetical protein